MLGPSWVATISAGSLMSLAKLAAWGQPQYVAATAVLAMLGLALLIFLQTVAPPGGLEPNMFNGLGLGCVLNLSAALNMPLTLLSPAAAV
mgnify:CR=1 FL=1